MKEISHVVVHNGCGTVECLACGATKQFDLPMPLEWWLNAAKQFTEEHRKCVAGEGGRA